MVLHPKARTYLDKLARANLPETHTLSPADARAQMTAGTIALGPPEPIKQIDDVTAPGPLGDIAIRILTPEQTGPRPMIVYFHGGGWVIGSVMTHEGLCRSLANATGCKVASVEYRLAPEFKYPSAIEDAYAAVKWLAEQGQSLGAQPGAIVVAGDSAGGNLAAAVCLVARDRGGPRIGAQIPIYPITDYNFSTRSYLDYADGHMLTRNNMLWFWDHYIADERQAVEPYVSVLRAPDLSGLPPALVITAECDPLCDEGNAYAERLREAGTPVTLACYEGMIHGFLRRPNDFPEARQAMAQIRALIEASFDSSSGGTATKPRP